MKVITILIVFLFSSCEKELDSFGCWEIYSKCSSEQYGTSNEVCGKTESDIKVIIQEYKDHDKVWSNDKCIYKYKQL
jgi:hypothetical protein